MKSRRHSLLSAAALTVLASTAPSFAGLNGPYTADADTAYLFHLDTPAGANFTTSAGGNLDTLGALPDAFSIDGATERNTEAPPYALVTHVLGAKGSSGFGKCADFGTSSTSLGVMVDADGSNALANRGTDAATISHASIADANGSFTIEALINVPTITSGNRTIVSLDVDTGTRGLMFRINGSGQLEFAFNSGSGATILLPIPTAGPEAFVANQWFHVAAVHDNSTGQHNTTFYWTKLDAARTEAAPMGSSTAEIITPSVVGPIVIGNEVRDGSGDGLRGKIDEVRIYKGVRSATQFVFNAQLPDSDFDGMEDVWELEHFGNLSRDGTQDSDANGGADGLNDFEEFGAMTDPNDADSDDDTLIDGDEYHGTSNAFSPGDFTSPNDADSDDDGLSDAQENAAPATNPNDADTDDDGFSDHAERVQYGTDPTSSTSVPLLMTLIGTETRNGSFELLGPPPGTPNATKAPHWDTAPAGDVSYWSIWPVESTAENDSGAETGAHTHGVKRGYLQGGNAAYNLSSYIAKEGDVLGFSFDHMPGSGAVGLRGGIVYSDGGTITRLTAAEISSAATGNGKSLIYVVPAGSPIIGKAIGVGFKSTGAFNGVDSVKLTVNAPDADGDGLADFWEDQYFGNNDGSATPAELALQNGSGDPDTDTFNNAAEQTAGSNPTLAASKPGDIDGDGLGDAWENQHFNSLAATPGADPDGDRDTNLVEFTNSTTPTDKFSFFSSTADTVPDSWKSFYGISGQGGTSDLDEGTGDSLDNLGEFTANTSPVDKDSDNDGREDGAEISGVPTTNPLVADTDGDGLSDGEEVNTHNSNPNAPDSDADGFGDKYEVDHSSLPNDANSTPAQPNGFTLLENFEGAGMSVGQTFNGVNGWVTSDPGKTTVAADPANASNKVGQWVNGSMFKRLSELGLPIIQGNTGTLFFQLRCPTGGMDHSYGLSDDTNPGVFGSFEAQMATISGDFRVRNGGGTTTTAHDYATATWMNVWIVADNASDTCKVYVESPLGQTGQIEITTGSSFLFRNSATATAANALVSILFGENTGDNTVMIDNVYIDAKASNLANPLNASGDTDSDGLDDTWETTYFGGLAQTAAGDFDNDGTDNLTEFRLGLSPNDGKSIFAASRAANGAITWPSKTGTTFKIERSTSLGAGSWTTLEAAYPGTAGTTSYTDPAPPAGKAFYRITLN